MSPSVSRDFPIDAGIFTTAKVSLVDASTDADARDAILAIRGNKFPDRDIQLGHIAFAADTGSVSLKPDLAGGASVSFDITASVQNGVGVFTKAANAIEALDLVDAIPLAIVDSPGQRFVVIDWGYSVTASESLSHPVGVLASASFGVDVKRNALFAVVHRFSGDAGAREVLADAFSSWRLPRQVKFAGGDVNVKPATWLIAEADGSLALTVAATLGWNVNFAKDASLLGVTHNLSAKIDASLKATFGFNASGKYLVVAARESDAPVVRLQLWKRSTKGFHFGFNVIVGLQGADPQLPDNFDDFVNATLGVHGLQVVSDLRGWLENDLNQSVAGLAEETARDLLTRTTGIDANTEFEHARQALRDALGTWDSLPDTLPPLLWKLLLPAASPDLAVLQQFLGNLKNPQTGASAIAGALQHATFGDTPPGRFLEAIAQNGLLSLADRVGDVSALAEKVFSLVTGGVISRLQDFINEKLNLDQIRTAVDDTDFARVEGWLQNRLANFLDRQLKLDDLKDFQRAIRTLDSKAAGYYQAGVEALTKKYTAEFAATYQSTTTETALIDVDFDLSIDEAAQLFARIVEQSRLDDLLTKDIKGIALHQAKLTHEIKRRSTVDVHLPLFDFRGTHVNDAMVTLTAEEQGGRLLLYQLVQGRDDVTASSRASSELAVLASLKVANGQPPQLTSHGSISYEMRQVKADMRPLDLEARTTPFIRDYLGELFGGGDGSIRTFYTDLDTALSAATHNQSNHLGDVAVSMQLSLPATVLRGWFQPRDANHLVSDQMQISRALQFAFQKQLPALYFQDVTQYVLNETVAALLVWASLPVSTSIDFTGATLTLNTDHDVFWDWPVVDNRRAVARDSHTVARLAGRLSSIQTELREAGRSNADDFDPSKANRFIEQALNAVGDQFLRTLLVSESTLVNGATRALTKVSEALDAQATAPTRAIRALADFAGTLTKTFNDDVQTIYSGVSGRAIGPMLLVESSAALAPMGVKPRALLTIAALKQGHSFDLRGFIDGKTPRRSDLALTQTLVSL
jgi:hypothetical protein